MNVEVLLGSMEASTLKYENSKVLFKIDLWDFALQKLEEIPIRRNHLMIIKTVQTISIFKWD